MIPIPIGLTSRKAPIRADVWLQDVHLSDSLPVVSRAPRHMPALTFGPNGRVELRRIPVPEPEASEVLVAVEAVGLCGSDTMEWYRAPKAPLQLEGEPGRAVPRVEGGDLVVRRLRIGEAGHKLLGRHVEKPRRCVDGLRYRGEDGSAPRVGGARRKLGRGRGRSR